MESDGGSVIFSDTEHQQTDQKIDDLEMELRWKHAHVQKKYVCGSSQVALFDNASNLIWDDIYKMVPRDWYGGTGLDHTWNQDLQDLESCEIEPNGKGLYYIIHNLDRCNATNTDSQSCLKALTKAEAPEVVYIIQTYHQKKNTGFGSEKLKANESQAVLAELSQIYPQITLVVDALDECNEKTRIEFIGVLNKLVAESPNRVKILISSRQDIDSKCHFKHGPNLEVTAIDDRSDIAMFVDHQIATIGRFWQANISSELKDLVCTTLVEKSGGMFQWVVLMSNASHRTDTGHIKHHCHVEDVDEAKLIYPKAIELDHGEPLCLKHTGLRQRAVLSFELYSHLRAGVSRAYHSIKTLDLDLIFPTEQNLESNTARSALKVALASIASLTAIIASQYNPQRLLPRVSQQTYLLQAHDRLETLLAPSAPIFVTSCATCYGATILLHHLHSPDSYQNLFVTAGALCGLLFDLRSESWVSVGRSVPMFITIAMILSIVRHGFFQPFLNARALKAVDRFGNEGTIGGTAIGGEEKSFWIQENS